VDFVGRAALAALKDDPRDRRLVSVHAPGITLWHGESLLHGDDRRGHITSAGVAPTLGGGSVGLAWVHGELEADGWSVQVGTEWCRPPCNSSRTTIRRAIAPAPSVRGRDRAREGGDDDDENLHRCTHRLGRPVGGHGTGAGGAPCPGLAGAIDARDLDDLDVRIRGERRDPVSGIIAAPDVLATTSTIRTAVQAAIERDEQPFLAGGCCSELPGALAGARDALGRMGLAYLDGHLDLYDGITSRREKPPTCRWPWRWAWDPNHGSTCVTVRRSRRPTPRSSATGIWWNRSPTAWSIPTRSVG
jgi:hypothetical protein